MTQPRLADAADAPCQVRLTHTPTPIRTQSHHRFPSYLQRRLWGEVRLEERLNTCGTDHDSIHSWISWLLGEHYQPTLDPGRFVRAEAQMVVDWYRSEQAALGSRGFGDGPYGSGPYGGGPSGDPTAQWDGIE